MRPLPAAFLLAALPPPAQPLLTQIDIFRASTNGYHAYRIPTLVTAANGALVAFAEARRDNRGDPGLGDIDIVAVRSTDNGATWSPQQLIDDPGEKWAASNPTPLLDRSNGRLWLFFNRWQPGFGTEKSQPATANNQTWARYSDDHGLTWSAPRDLTRDSRDFDHWGAIFLGPGGAIQSKSGRLLVPAAMKYDAMSVIGPAGPISQLRAYVLYSDDHGQSWRRGALVPVFTNENQLVELANGDVLMDARQNGGEHRWFLPSPDGGQSWSRPRAGHALVPVATAIERFAPGLLIWTGPKGPARQHLVVRVSYDDGQTWINERTLYGGFSAYSDIAMLADGSAGVVFERGEREPYQSVTFVRFNRAFLEPPGTLIPSVRR